MDATDFTRNRSLPLPHLVAMLLNLRQGSIGDELDRFFEVVLDEPLADSITPSAFCQARKKLNPDALLGLNEPLLAGFEVQCSPRLWHGFRLLAADGSTARLGYQLKPGRPIKSSGYAARHHPDCPGLSG
jgi:hypothetical protein